MLTLDEVRKNIDRVDGEIKKLFVERMQLADQVAQVKARTADAIYKPDRENAIIEKQSGDMDENLVMEYRALIKRIMEVSRKYQYGRTLELRDCFPYDFQTEESEVKTVAMIKPELYICDMYSKDSVQTVDTFEEVGALVQEGRVDAGMGIIEEIGCGVSDGLNTMLLGHGLYINRCEVKTEKNVKRKVVLFSRNLIVEPEHNRLKLVFISPNRSGALGSILSMIADYGVNLTEIHSIPFRDGKDWNYKFFAELNLNLLKKESQALLFQLSQETLSLQILGSYFCEGDFHD